MTRIQYRRYKNMLSAWALLLLIALAAAVIHIDTVCGAGAAEISKQQVDTIAKPAAAEPPKPIVDLTSADYDLICRVVAAEARGEGYVGQLAVAQVIRDRIQLWGMTPREVVTASGQFARPYQGDIGADVQAAVNDCFVQGASAFSEPVTHFAEASVTPYWVKSKTFVGQIGNHRFYK